MSLQDKNEFSFGQLKQLDRDVLINVYGRDASKTPMFIKGNGPYLYDERERKYLDFLSGLGVCNLGHAPKQVVEAAKAQLDQLVHTSNLYYTVPQIYLAKRLVDNSFADKVFFANSGAEVNEAAIKLARKYAYNQYGPGHHKIITAKQSFHGRSLATVAATGQEKVKKGFAPLPEGFIHVPLNDLSALNDHVDDSTCAIIVEPIQGEGGVNICTQEYLQQVKDICLEKDVLLIFDEIQTGMGRTGDLFCYKNYDIEPDIMTLAKGLGGGLPIGAMLATEKAAQGFSPGDHASTFGGNPVASAAGVAVLDKMLEKNFLSSVRQKAEYLSGKLEILKDQTHIQEIRQMGMMAGIEIESGAKQVFNFALDNKLLVNAIGDQVIRLLPPLVVSQEDIDAAIHILQKGIKSIQ